MQLRWFAALGQALAIWVALHWLALPLPAWPLWLGVVALVCFNGYLTLRRRTLPGTPALAVLHLAVDISELSWAIGWSGGVMNPFVSLFLVPIALSTLALPVRHIVWVAVMALGRGLDLALDPTTSSEVFAYANVLGANTWGWRRSRRATLASYCWRRTARGAEMSHSWG